MSSEFDIKEHIKELDKKSTISRLWKRDYTLWDDQDAEINNRLGWLTAAAQMKTQLEEIEATHETHIIPVARDGYHQEHYELVCAGSE